MRGTASVGAPALAPGSHARGSVYAALIADLYVRGHGSVTRATAPTVASDQRTEEKSILLERSCSGIGSVLVSTNAAFCCKRCNKIAVNEGAVAPQLHSVPQCV